MAITYNKVKNEVATILGAILGESSATAEANYVATMADGTLDGPDFTKTMIEDAIVAALGEIVEAIAFTPLHPERARFGDVTSALANRAAIPRTGSGTGKLIVGVPGAVRDSGNLETLTSQTLEAMRSYNRFPLVYGYTTYWYSINAGRIEHTRANVLIDVCVFERPTSFGGNIDIDDHHEGGLVANAVMRLTPKESMYGELWTEVKQQRDDHLATIRAYSNPDLYGRAHASQSAT